MPKYRLSITSTVDRIYEVDAESEEEARDTYLLAGHLTAQADGPDAIDWIEDITNA